jgi:two-component system sensor kinase FixL
LSVKFEPVLLVRGLWRVNDSCRQTTAVARAPRGTSRRDGAANDDAGTTRVFTPGGGTGGTVPFLGEFARVAAVTILPVLLFALAVITVLAVQERSAVLDAIDHRARVTAAEIDRIFDRQISVLATLAGSKALDTGDLARFYAEAERTRTLYPEWFTIIVSDPQTGQQLANLLRPLGEPLPRFSNLATHSQVVRDRKPVIVATPQLRGALTGLPVFGIRVPVVREGRVVYVLTAGLKRETLDNFLAQLDLRPGWTIDVIGAEGRIIACPHCAEATIGAAVPGAVQERIDAKQSGVVTAVDRHGRESHMALGRAPVTGWTVRMSMPTALVTRLWQRELWIVALGGLISFATALAATAWLTRRRQGLRHLLEGRVRQATAELRESEERYTRLADATREGVAIHDAGRIVEANASFARMFGYAPHEVVEKAPIDFIAPEARDEARARTGDAGEHRYESIGLRKDGSSFPAEFYEQTVDYHGAPMQVGIVRDLTAQKQADERLRELELELLHASRVTDMGQLAAALAHELTQPLTAVANYVHACRLLLGSGRLDDLRIHQTRDLLNRVNDQALHAGKIIHRLREFVAKRETRRQIEPAAALVEEASALALISARQNGVKASLALATTAEVEVDRVQIQQVLVNLIRNAVEAMAASERKDMEVRAVATGGSVEISVSDTGEGLAPHVAERLFQPFTSTKNQGMGLGLSVCRAIVEAHEGRIWCEPNAGGGTIFRFTLPAVREQRLASAG